MTVEPIVCRRTEGGCVEVQDAPDQSTITLDVLTHADRYGVRYRDGLLWIGDPLAVTYRIVGWEPDTHTFTIEKVAEHRVD